MRLSLALVTDDLVRLRAFYRELFRTPWFGDDTYVEFRPGVDWLLAITTTASLDVHVPGAHVASTNRSVRIEVAVADVDAEYERLFPLASEIVAPPTDWPWGTRSTWLRDPDGNLVSLFSVAGSAPVIQGVTVEVAELDRSRRFYEGVLGFHPGEFYEPTRWQPYEFGNQFFGVREVPGAARRDREDILNFAVGDVDALWLRVRNAVEVVDALTRTPWGSYKFVIADPDGFKLGFVAGP
jgi:predicted enzyme related to lactoylglutathione lyase